MIVFILGYYIFLNRNRLTVQYQQLDNNVKYLRVLLWKYLTLALKVIHRGITNPSEHEKFTNSGSIRAQRCRR